MKRILCIAMIAHGALTAEQNLNILIVGGGGREHALAWKAAQSPLVKKVFVAPGNAGTAQEPKVENIPLTSVESLIFFAQQHAIDLTIIGPETMLEHGIVDQFTKQGLRCFGPTQKAAQLETSKVYAKQFMMRHSIPTAASKSFCTFSDACDYIRQQQKFPLVIKADGLAAGKGVVIAQTQEEALTAVEDMLVKQIFGTAGNNIIVEEFLEGEEVTFIVITDGVTIIPLAPAQDHKRRDTGDKGPNTGGMGAYCPAPIITPEIHERIMNSIIKPTITGMAHDGIPYCGFLYAGLMITANGPKVLEYNCRLGDPETQPILMRLQSDLIALCAATLDQKLNTMNISWDDRVALGVVLATGNYPYGPSATESIQGLEKIHDPAVKIFYSGAELRDGSLVTAGGRVLCVTALGDTVRDAQHKAYAAVNTISWPNMVYRTDIGYRALDRETSL